MPNDRARLRADFPKWHEPLFNLVGGMAVGVISVAELERDIGRDSLATFLQGYGAGLPTTPLHDFLRRLRKLRASSEVEPATYQSFHDIGRRSRDPFWQHSVSLGRVLRREKFSWNDRPLEGLARLHAYLEAAKAMSERLNIEPFTSYGRYILFKDLHIDLPWWQLIDTADFDVLDTMINAIELLPIDALDRAMLPIKIINRSQIKALRKDYAELRDKMAIIRRSVRRSDLIAGASWQSEIAPREVWVAALASTLGLGLEKASNGFWWLHPKERR